MRGHVDATACDRLIARLDRVEPTRAEWAALGEMLEKVLVEDNRRGVLAGTDRFGNPMAPVTYRTGRALQVRFRKTTSTRFGTVAPTRGRRGSLPHNNLTTAEYQKLHGPPLAPRGAGSRVITNLVTRTVALPNGVLAEGAWADVLDAKGRPFLRYHFEGDGQTRRDLRGVRPDGMALARKILTDWLRALMGV